MTSPGLSVVIPWVNSFERLQGTLGMLGRQEGPRGRLEVVVVERHGASARTRLCAAFPEAVVVSVPGDTHIPAMRARGVESATLPNVAVIEDHILVPQHWQAEIERRLARADVVIGGPIENAATGAVSHRAAFWCEYGHALPPLPDGEVSWLPGNNVAYPRDAIRRHLPLLREGAWENELHDALRREGLPLLRDTRLTVKHDLPIPARRYLSQRFLYSRAFAGRRLRGASLAKRLVYALAACGLPVVLLGRIGSRVWALPAHRVDLLKSLPLLVLFVVVWAAGESVGYLVGEGKALAKVC